MVLIFLYVFAGCQGGRYYLANRLQELGILSAMLLLLIGGWQAMYRLSLREWAAWCLKPVALMLGVMGISSLVFYFNYSGNPLYSFFSAREVMLLMGGPGIYLLYRSDLPLSCIERAIYTGLLALMLNYLFFYYTMDLKAAFFSSDHTVSNLVTYDEWRGFRLKPPLFAVMVVLLSALMAMLQGGKGWLRWLSVLAFSAACYIWSIVLFRSILAAMLLAIMLYPLFLSSIQRVQNGMVALPLILLVIPAAAQMAGDLFLNADGGNIRGKAFLLAFEQIAINPILGAGEDSAYGQTYQQIVAPYFYPDDIGWVGILFKYGIVGGVLYLYLHLRIWTRLWKANVYHRMRYHRHNPLIWALLLWLTALTFNMLLNAGLAYAQGITLGSLGYAVASMHLYSCRKNAVCNV